MRIAPVSVFNAVAEILPRRSFQTVAMSLAAGCLLLAVLPAVAKQVRYSNAGNASVRHTEDDDTSDRRGERILIMRQYSNPYQRVKGGSTRAESLARFILNNYGRPDFIYVANQSRYTPTRDMLAPLSELSGVKIAGGGDYRSLASKLLKQSQYEGKLIVVAWNSENMPAFARALNAQPQKYAVNWSPRYSNQMLQLDYPSGANNPEVLQFTEPY
jgi:hypothetical protein